MIFYFSGTGNNRSIAKKLAHKLNEDAFDIMDVDVNRISLKQGGTLGFVFPIYAWGVPKVMIEFIQNLIKTITIPEQTFCYGIGGCGLNLGNAFKQIEKSIKLDSAYSISMPNNYIIGSDIDNPEIIAQKLADAEQRIQLISEQIIARQSVFDFVKGSLPGLKTNLIAPMMAKFAPTMGKNFHSDSKCIGCGLCVTYCRFDNIEMVDHKPVWKKNCHLCMACINRCPQQAIQYGKQTGNRGRYYLEDK